MNGLVRETAVSALNQRFLNFNYVYIAFLGLKRLLKNPLLIPLFSAFCIIYLFIYLFFWVSVKYEGLHGVITFTANGSNFGKFTANG